MGTRERVKFIKAKCEEEIKTIKMDKVCSSNGLAGNWYFRPDIKITDKFRIEKINKEWGYASKFMQQDEFRAFKKFWREVGAGVFAKWLWENNKANGSEMIDGYIPICWVNNKGNRVLFRSKKYTKWHKEYDAIEKAKAKQ